MKPANKLSSQFETSGSPDEIVQGLFVAGLVASLAAWSVWIGCICGVIEAGARDGR